MRTSSSPPQVSAYQHWVVQLAGLVAGLGVATAEVVALLVQELGCCLENPYYYVYHASQASSRVVHISYPR